MPALLPICWVVLLIAFVVVLIVANNKVKERERERKQKESEAKKRRIREHYEKMRMKYESEMPARRVLIAQLYKEKIDLKETTFILRKAGYLGVTGEKITMKEIMDEHAQIQIDKHMEILKGDEQEQEEEGQA